MKKIIIINLVLLIAITTNIYAQKKKDDGFDEKKAYIDAKAKGIPDSDIKGYLRAKHLEHKHTNSQPVLDLGTIYKSYNNNSAFKSNPPQNSVQNTYCPNAGFEQLNFSNWTGSTGTVDDGATGAGSPIYTQTGNTIVNGAGNDAGLTNPLNYHTITTVPAINNVYPNCVGYDSIACRVIGTQTISEIPVVNPNGGPSSVRLNGAIANYRACKINYQMALNPNNKNFTISYALVLENANHLPNEQPYFYVKIKDQNGNLVPGCSVYTITCNADLTDPNSPIYDPTWKDAVIGSSIFGDGVMYRPWTTYAFDFSNYPAITDVNVEFYVGGCSVSGHFGYAYVDASCGQGGAVASFCAGSGASVLTAPLGYTSYQWSGPNGPVSASNGGSTPTATISPASVGDVFTCNVTTANGCNSAFQTTIAITTLSITNVNSIPSCASGNSGGATVFTTGSSLGVSYQWFDNNNVSVGSTKTVTGLSPGTYSVVVSSSSCGTATETFTVGISPPIYYGLSAPFCGTIAWIKNAGAGSNYKWYRASPLSIISGATSSSLTVANPVDGDQYFSVFTNASGCVDSIKYTLTQTPGGNISVTNVKSICVGNSNSYAVINLQTNALPASYSYSVSGPNGFTYSLLNKPVLKDSVTGLSIGNYSVSVFDGECLYNTTFTVHPFVYTYTLSPTTATICSAGTKTLSVNFSDTPPSSCGLSGSGGCASPNQITIGTGNVVNTTLSYPSVYGHYYKNARHQMIYTAAELLSMGVVPGNLSSIAFKINSIPATYIGSVKGLKIALKCTQLSDFSAFNVDFDNTGLVQVFNAANYVPVVGWNQHNFPSAYEWDGTSNLLVDVCFDIDPNVVNFTLNVIMASTTLSVDRCLYDRDDTDPMCGSSGNFPTSTNKRLNTKFGNCGVSNPSLFSYTWTPSSSLAPINTYSTIANPLVTTEYTVQVEPIGQLNCIQAQTSTITVYTPVTPTITPISPLCNNATSLSFSVDPVGGAWTGNSVSSAGTLSVQALTQGIYTYTYTHGAGICPSTGTTSVDVTDFVSANITGVAGPYCIYDLPDDVQFTAQNTGGIWSGNGLTNSIFDPSIAGAGSHTLTYSTDAGGAGLCPDQHTIEVVVNPKPEADALTNKIKGCTPLDVNFSTSTVVGGNATWNFGDGSAKQTGLSLSHIYTTAGTYTAVITYTDAVGCLDTTQITTAITVDPLPIASFIPSLFSTTVIDGQLDFINNSTVLNDNLYSWDMGGLGTFSTTNISYLFANAGKYNVTLTAMNTFGCMDDTLIVITIEPDLIYYVPNAFTPNNEDGLNDEFRVVFPVSEDAYSNFTLTIFDRWGTAVFDANTPNKAWNGRKKNTGPNILKPDVYVWKMSFYDERKKFHEKTGHVTLIK